MPTTQATTTATAMVTRKRNIQGKSVRLLDFHVSDEPEESEPGSPNSDPDAPKPRPGTRFTIQMFGINEKGETFSIFVTDFQPFFYVLVADHWGQDHCNTFRRELLAKLGGGGRAVAEANLVGVELAEFHKLYGFTAGKQSKFVRLTFRNAMTMMRVRNFWYVSLPAKTEGAWPERKLVPLVSQGCRLALYESRLPPLLRYFHLTQLSPSGWVFVPQHTLTAEATTTCKYEYRCTLKDLIPQPDKETRVPYKICSFDIEASSSHGDFPLPIKTYKRLATQLVDIFVQQTAVQTHLGADQEKLLVKRIVLAAFGHGKFSDVDLVYPKEGKIPSRHKLETSLLPRWFAHVCMHPDGTPMTTVQGSRVMSIEGMFEKMKPDMEFGNAEGEDDGEDGDGNGGNGEGLDLADMQVYEYDEPDPELKLGMDSSSHTCSKAASEQHETTSKYSEKKEPTKAPKKSVSKSMAATAAEGTAPKHITVLDILKSRDYTRDDKIGVVNTAFCAPENGFPALEGDRVTFIGSTFMRYGEPEPYLNHCLVLNTCDPVPGAVIETVTNERDLLTQWTELIQRENPDIVIGYNIFGFDYEFMFRRSQETGCVHEFLALSRRLAPEDEDDEAAAGGDEAAAEPRLENTKIVLATGEYDLRYPSTPGRLQIDMYTYFRRDFNLASYKLDDVAGQFIRDDIKQVRLAGEGDEARTELYTNNVVGLHTGDYIHLEISGFTSDYFRNGHKFQVVDMYPATAEASGTNGSKQVVCIAGHEPELLEKHQSLKWCMAKDDVSPQDIFRLANGSAADRARVAKYCIQDCNLVHHLLNKIDVITGYVEMARICSVPISFLIFRGQGIKLTSYVSKKCREKHTLMPDLEKSYEADGYEGAIVLPPKCSMYMDNPVACLDYASLYPSSMISNNLSPDSKVWTKEYDLEGNLLRETGEKHPKTGAYIYDNLEHLGYKYIDVTFDTFQWRRNPEKPRAQAVKTKTGTKICRWVQLPNHQKSIMPAILEELLQARANTRKLIKSEKDPFMQNILDKRQLGYKVTANSLYGQCGARTSTFYEKDVAASTTATGRQMITYAKRIIEEVYGDLDYTTEDQSDVKCCAEYVYGDSVAYYTPVTIRVGHHVRICTIEDVAKQYGMNRWTTSADDSDPVPKEYCELNLIPVESWTDQGWTRIHRVIRHRLAPHKQMVRIITNTAMVDVTDDHSLLTADGQPISPKEVSLNTPLLHRNVQMNRIGANADFVSEGIMRLKNPAFLREGTYTFHYPDSNACRQQTQVEIAEHYFAMHQMGYEVRMEAHASTNSVILHARPATDLQSKPSTVQKVEILPAYGDEYVYDFTTENHHFAAGIGNMIVHNTDSVFFTFNLKHPQTQEPIRGKRALELTIEIAQDAAKLCTQFLKPPMELSYEKTLMPFILLSKKRYVGMLYETNPNKGKLKYMGLSLKRRDSCDYLKDTYGGILNRLMKETDENAPDGKTNIQHAVEFLDRSLQDLIDGNVPMEKLTITKALRGHYKNPQQIAHAVLAERIGQRDPGNKPKPGDRMKFVHVVHKNAKALQGEKIEVPQYILENKLRIDYTFYITNQLMKPLQQLFGLALEPICRFNNKHMMVRTIRKDIAEIEREYGDSIEVFMKKREKYCSAKVKTLLFDRYLVDIDNQKNGLRTIQSCFQAAPSALTAAAAPPSAAIPSQRTVTRRRATATATT